MLKRLYCTMPKDWSVCICSNHVFHLRLLLSLFPLHCTQRDSTRMGFKPHRICPEFHVHIRRLGSWVAEGRWTFAGKRSGIVGCWASWIGFPDLGSFYGVQWLQFPSVTLYSKKLWGYTVSSELFLTEFSCEWAYVWIYIYTLTCSND